MLLVKNIKVSFLVWLLISLSIPLSMTYYYIVSKFLSINSNIDLKLIWTNYYYNGNLFIFKSYQIHLLLFLLTILIFKTNDKKGKI
jgi:hypothetical protein